MQDVETIVVKPGTARIPATTLTSSQKTRFARQRTPLAGQAPSTASQLSQLLGWFSVGLGLAELLMPRRIARAAGMAQHPRLFRAMGLRELVSGAGILTRPHPTGWLWSRVAGDAIDLALLGMAGRRSTHSQRLAFVTAAVTGITVLDLLASAAQSRRFGAAQFMEASRAVQVKKTLTVNRSAEECYRFWRNFENFPRFMAHLDSVQQVDSHRSHWVAHAPLGRQVEWTAELTADRPGHELGWRSIAGSDIDHAGAIRFSAAPGGRGTRIEVDLRYVPPFGKAGVTVAKLFGEEPAQQIDEDLRRFKQLIETGEIPTTVGQSAGKRGALTRLLRKGAPG